MKRWFKHPSGNTKIDDGTLRLLYAARLMEDGDDYPTAMRKAKSESLLTMARFCETPELQEVG